MSKHDSWIQVNDPYLIEVASLFPEGMLPARDPIPMEFYENKLTLFVLDNERLDDGHFKAIVDCLANKWTRREEEILQDFEQIGFFATLSESVSSVYTGIEGFVRTIEWVKFMDENDPNDPLTSLKLLEFLKAHKAKWVEGDQQPNLQLAWSEFPDHLKDDQMRRMYNHLTANQLLEKSHYSALDMIFGKAPVDTLNEIDPDAKYSLVNDDEDDEDDEEVIWI